LRGNGPTSVVFGDAMLTLVDNAFDVRMQDITMERGDRFDGFTKRLSVAVVMNRMLTSTQNRVLNKTFSCIRYVLRVSRIPSCTVLPLTRRLTVQTDGR
jgi:hypothetical protein